MRTKCAGGPYAASRSLHEAATRSAAVSSASGPVWERSQREFSSACDWLLTSRAGEPDLEPGLVLVLVLVLDLETEIEV